MLPAPTLPEREVPARPLGGEAPSCIAFVDLETTGLDPSRHEILEIGVVLVEARSLEVISERELLVAPARIEDADPVALEIAGYSEARWADAMPLAEALLAIAPLLEGSLLAGHNVGFDWGFLEAGYRQAGLALPRVDYHRVDTASLAWPLVASGELASLSLDAVAAYFGLARPTPHRALADARCSLEVARRLSDRMRLGGRLARLPSDEQALSEALLGRLELGRKEYGAWSVDDGRDYPSEALAELVDGLHYLAAELVRRRRLERSRRRRVYVCHPFADDPAGNIERVRHISLGLVALGEMPVAPHLYLPQLFDEAVERDRALECCLELVDTCDEVRVFGRRITPGMALEIDHAKARKIPVRFEEAVLA